MIYYLELTAGYGLALLLGAWVLSCIGEGDWDLGDLVVGGGLILAALWLARFLL